MWILGGILIDTEGWEDRNDAEDSANQRVAAQAASYVDGDDSGDEGDGSAFGTYGGPDRDWHSLV